MSTTHPTADDKTTPSSHRQPKTPAPSAPQAHTATQAPSGTGSSADGAALEMANPPAKEMMKQAKCDLDAGRVDTDMHATPGLDAQRRKQLVPTPTVGGVDGVKS